MLCPKIAGLFNFDFGLSHTLRLSKRNEKVACCKVLENVRYNSEIVIIFCLSARYGWRFSVVRYL